MQEVVDYPPAPTPSFSPSFSFSYPFPLLPLSPTVCAHILYPTYTFLHLQPTRLHRPDGRRELSPFFRKRD